VDSKLKLKEKNW